MHCNIRLYKNINKFSWILIFSFICATFAMQNYSGGISSEGFFLLLPMISIMVFWSQKSAHLLALPDFKLKKNDVFNRDLFTICFSLIVAELLSLLFQYNNSDTRGWWVLFIYFAGACDFIFALIFSLIGLILPHHRRYMIIFAYLIFLTFVFSKFWPHYVSILFFGEIDTFFVIMCALISMHFLFFICCKLIKWVYENFSI